MTFSDNYYCTGVECKLNLETQEYTASNIKNSNNNITIIKYILDSLL